MVKLTGVKTIDMAGGEITKISYKGEEYAKIEADSEKGDIGLRITNQRSWAQVGAFYPVLSDGCYSDDAGDEPYMATEDFVVFRKINASQSDGGELSAKVDDLDKRVTALENGEAKPEYKTVKRAAKVGERILITNASQTNGLYENGDVLTVEDSDAGFSYGTIEPIEINRLVYASEYEVIVAEAPSEPLKVGEVVRVKEGAVSRFEDIRAGQIVRITDNGMGERYPIRVKLLDGSDFDYFREQDVERLADVGANKPKLKVGDYAVVLNERSSQFGQVVEVRKEDARAYDFRCYDLRGEHNVLYDAHELRKATPAEVAEAKAKALKTGDIVVITANTNHSRNKVGDIGMVGHSGIFDSVAVVDVPSRPDSRFVNGNYTKTDEMRLATAQERAQYRKAFADANKPKLKAGDYVKFARDGIDIKAGKAYEVREDSDGDLYFIDDDSYRRYSAIKLGEYDRVDEPARKFKKGDLVRLTEDTGADDAGTIVEVLKDGGGKYRRIDRDREWFGGHASWYELVAPVESRADRV